MTPNRGDGRPLRYLLGGAPVRQWLTMAELAEHGKFLTRDGRHFSPEAARLFVKRHPDLPRGRKGRAFIVDRAVFDRYMEECGRRSA